MIAELELKGRKVVVVGGGRSAEIKVRSLLRSGACITVIAPQISERIKALAEKGKVKVIKRKVRASDITKDTFAVVECTGDAHITRKLREICTRRKVLFSSSSQPELSDFRFLAQRSTGGVAVAVKTGSPLISVELAKLFVKLAQKIPRKRAKSRSEAKSLVELSLSEAERIKSKNQKKKT